MNLLRTLVIAALLQTAPQAPAQQNIPAGSIEGGVLRAASGEPLFHAQLKLTKALTPEEERESWRDGNDPDENAPTVFTETNGSFVFKNVAPGPYHLTATHNGYAPQMFGQKMLNGPSAIINVQSGQVVKDVTVRMIQGGIVTGRVRDTKGEPIVGLGVALMRMEYSIEGGRALYGGDQTMTDDRGEYRFYWVQPGRYYVKTSRSGPYFPGRKEVVDIEPVLPTFFPGVLDPESASAIEVQAGGELGGVDIVVPRPSGYRIRGKIVDSSTGKPPKSASVSMSSRKSAAIRVYENYGAGPQAQTYDPVAGTFEIRNVLPGSYWITVNSRAGYNEPLSADKLAEVKTQEDLFEVAFRSGGVGAQALIDVSGADINDVVITLTKGMTIPVQVSVEGQQFSAVKGAEEIRVTLEPAIFNSNGFWQSGRVNAEGITKIDNVQPGEYRVYVDEGKTKDLYTREMSYGRADVLYESLVISDQSPSALTVVLSSKGGQIEGNLTDALSQPANGAEVVLVPDQRNKKRVYSTVPADHNGHFVFRAVPPGGYKVFSWEALQRSAYYDSEVLSRYETQGVPVRVQESSKETVNLRIIPAPKQ